MWDLPSSGVKETAEPDRAIVLTCKALSVEIEMKGEAVMSRKIIFVRNSTKRE
jgi:hypothetical protein